MTPEELHHLTETIIESNRRVFTRERTFADWAVFVRDALKEAFTTEEKTDD